MKLEYFFLPWRIRVDTDNEFITVEQRNWYIVGILVGFPLFIHGDYTGEEELTGGFFSSPPLVEEL